MEVTEVKPNNAASIIETDCNVDFDEPVGYVAPQKPAQGSKGGGAVGSSDSNADADSSAGTAFPARAVQRARVVNDDDSAAAAGVFTAFSGSAQRIDGKVKSVGAGAGAGAGAGGAASSPADMRQAALKAAQARADAVSAAAAGAPGAVAPVRKSRIGEQFSTKKANASAFSGSGSKLG